MKLTRTIGLSLGLFLSILLLHGVALAVVQQTDGNTATAKHWHVTKQNLGTGISTDTVLSVDLKIRSDSIGSGNLNMYVTFEDGGTGCGLETSDLVSFNYNNPDPQTISFPFTLEGDIGITDTCVLRINVDNSALRHFFYGSSTNAYPNGYAIFSEHPDYNVGDSAVQDLYFIINDTPPISCDLEYPPDTDYVSPDFSSWFISGQNIIPTGTDRYFASVSYGLAPAQYYTQSDGYPDFDGGATISLSVDKNFILYPGMTYYAITQIHDSTITEDSNTICTSEEISFTTTGNTIPEALADLEDNFPTITPGTTTFLPPTDPDSPFYVNCSAYDDVGFFELGTFKMIACQAKKTTYEIVYEMLYPHKWSQQGLINSVNYVKQGFPFSIVYGIKNAIDTSLDQEFASESITTDIFWGNEITVLDANVLENTFGEETKDLIFNVITSFGWVVAGVGMLIVIF